MDVDDSRAAPAESDGALVVGARTTEAVRAWLGALRPAQRARARFPGPHSAAGEQARHRWFYTPTNNDGLSLGEQDPAQQGLAMRVVASGLSEAGYITVAVVLGLENVLDRLEGWSMYWGRPRGRDPGGYWLAVFGEPGEQAWGWRFGGHHVSLNNVLVGGRLVATTPNFIGADPATSLLLGRQPLRPLGAGEDLARSLLLSLDEHQRRQAMLLARAPSDIINGNRPFVAAGAEMLHMNEVALWSGPFSDPALVALVDDIDRRAESGAGFDAADHATMAITTSPRGIAGSSLDPEQRQLLASLLSVYLGRAPELAQVAPTADQLDAIHFAWAGGDRPGDGHYYRLQAPNLLVEYDNTQRDANHIHSVWRDPANDFGRDDLRRHLGRTRLTT